MKHEAYVPESAPLLHRIEAMTKGLTLGSLTAADFVRYADGAPGAFAALARAVWDLYDQKEALRSKASEEAIRSLARARATAHAAGYAEAVADVVEMMRDHVRRAENVMRKSHFDRGPFDASTLQAGAYVRGATWALDRIDSGAHVGAAKKGGS